MKRAYSKKVGFINILTLQFQKEFEERVQTEQEVAQKNECSDQVLPM